MSLLFAGVVSLALAAAWWGVTFRTALSTGLLSLREASLCMFDSSGLCEAVAAMCVQDHPLNIRAYSPSLLWIGLSLAGAGLLAGFTASPGSGWAGRRRRLCALERKHRDKHRL
ncbi:MAG: hypothetical protein IRZ09_07800 [Variibacter sp.]|nr:hypothetical protein [Variibacter sp.]